MVDPLNSMTLTAHCTLHSAHCTLLPWRPVENRGARGLAAVSPEEHKHRGVVGKARPAVDGEHQPDYPHGMPESTRSMVCCCCLEELADSARAIAVGLLSPDPFLLRLSRAGYPPRGAPMPGTREHV